jgi:hypothetical protein
LVIFVSRSLYDLISMDISNLNFGFSILDEQSFVSHRKAVAFEEADSLIYIVSKL